ncbi:aromatic-ring-hydroxylating dioxygenase subunit beta [Actinomadura macra]|uniref:aromatic-ring-hydroxylating dioxygenase subunit beta n=1 Tax=Actinomadura macra TaxID=46164 RepID=UPI000834FBD1|nr:aromatic-ring-hydroxylating dioxygenase subunit beta [Actinomadura macra]
MTFPLAANRDLTYEVEQFFYRESQMLDDRRFRDWLALTTPDIDYRMPTQYDVGPREQARLPMTLHHLEEDRESLERRIIRLLSGRAWTDEPFMHVRRLLSNIVVVAADEDEVHTRCCFTVYRSKPTTGPETFVGRRDDVLVHGGDLGFLVRKRVITLDQSVVHYGTIPELL